MDDLLLFQALRTNAKLSYVSLGKIAQIPKSTVFDKVQRLEKEYVKRYLVLLDFSALGYCARAQFFFTVPKETRLLLEQYLHYHEHVNSLFRVNTGSQYCCELVFKTMEQLDEFIEELITKYALTEHQLYLISRDLKREEFLTLL